MWWRSGIKFNVGQTVIRGFKYDRFVLELCRGGYGVLWKLMLISLNVFCGAGRHLLLFLLNFSREAEFICESKEWPPAGYCV